MSSRSILALVILVCLAFLACPVALAGGPYTIHGVVVTVDDRPIAGWPIRINPFLPDGEYPDTRNQFYKIPGFDDHFTHTDQDGRFVMAGVQDYPEVKHRKYRLWSGGTDTEATRIKISPYIFASYSLDLSTASSQDIYVVIKSSPASALKIVAKDSKGQPYNGSLSIGVVSGKHFQNRTAIFKNGESLIPGIPLANAQEPGRLIILPEKTNTETKNRVFEQGKDLGSATIKEGGIILDKRVAFIPFQTATVEVNLPFETQ